MDTWADALRRCSLRLVLGRPAAGKEHIEDCRLTWADDVADVVGTGWELQVVPEEDTDAAVVVVTLAVGAGGLVAAAGKVADLAVVAAEEEGGFAAGEELADAEKQAVAMALEPQQAEADVDRVGEERMRCGKLTGRVRWAGRESRCNLVTRCSSSEVDEQRKMELKAALKLQQHFEVQKLVELQS